MALEWMVVGLIKSMEGPDLLFLRAAIYRVLEVYRLLRPEGKNSIP